MSCGCRMQLGNKSLTDASPAHILSHLSHDDTQDPRQRATHHVGQGAVPQYQLGEPHFVVGDGTCICILLTQFTMYQQALIFFLPFRPPPTPIFSLLDACEAY